MRAHVMQKMEETEIMIIAKYVVKLWELREPTGSAPTGSAPTSLMEASCAKTSPPCLSPLLSAKDQKADDFERIF